MAAGLKRRGRLLPIFDNEIGFNEFHYIWNKIKRLAPIWDMVAILLYLHPYLIEEIEKKFPNDDEKRLRRSLTHWLAKDYLHEIYGPPTWRMLYECILNKGGGNDPVLAEEIAKEKGSLDAMFKPDPYRGYVPQYYRRWCLESPSSERRFAFNSILFHDTAPYVKRTLHSIRDAHVLGFVQRLHKLELQFAEAVYETRDAIPKHLLPEMMDYASFHLTTILSPAHTKYSRIESMREWINMSGTVSFFIMNITKYMSWFNYGLMLRLVKVYLSDNKKLVKMWCRYRESVKELFAADNHFAVQYGGAVDFGLAKCITSKIMILKVVREDYTMNDLFFFHEAIPKALRVGDYRFYLCRVDRGCLELTYSIPDTIYSMLFPLTSEQCHSLAEIGIYKLTCEEYIYEMDRLPSLHKGQLSSLADITIYDPLWYENTNTPLHEACWNGNIQEVKWFLNNNRFGQSMLNDNINGWTPPLSAVYGGHIDVLHLLIDRYNITQSNDDGVTVLHIASYKGHVNIVHCLLNEYHFDPDIADSSGNTALLYSALGGHVDLVTFFIKKKCSILKCNKEGSTLSLLACKSGNMALVRLLLALQLFSKDIDYIGRGIVHYSCMTHNSEVFQYMLTNYGQIILTKRDNYSRTPLHFASQFGSPSITLIIVQQLGYDALLDTDHFGWSPLHYMCCALIKTFNTTAIFNKLFVACDLRFLLQFDQETNTYGEYIQLNFNTSKLHDRVSLFSTLLRKASGCPMFDVNFTTKSGQLLMHLAHTSGNVLLVNVLEDLKLECSDSCITTVC